jgi:hypothetical protein
VRATTGNSLPIEPQKGEQPPPSMSVERSLDRGLLAVAYPIEKLALGTKLADPRRPQTLLKVHPWPIRTVLAPVPRLRPVALAIRCAISHAPISVDGPRSLPKNLSHSIDWNPHVANENRCSVVSHQGLCTVENLC